MKTLPFLALALLAAPSLADTLVLEVPGIQGDSTVPGFVDAIDVDNYSFSAAVFGGGSPSTYFGIDAKRDQSFPPMVIACLEGQVLGDVRLSAIAGNGVVRAELTLTSAVCVSASMGVGYDGTQGTQSYAFDFATAVWQYTDPQGKDKGTISTPGSSVTPPGGGPQNMTSMAGGGVSGLFLELGDIQGGSSVFGYEGNVDAVSAQWGVSNQGGFRYFGELNASTEFDSAFGPAHTLLVDGKVLNGPAELELVSLGHVRFKLRLSNSKVRNASAFGVDGSPATSTYSLDYEVIEVFHTLFGGNGQPQGVIAVGWDLISDTSL